jgi:hypothetical protein
VDYSGYDLPVEFTATRQKSATLTKHNTPRIQEAINLQKKKPWLLTQAPSIAVDKNYRKIYQWKKTPTPVYEKQWAPNTIQAIIMICNAKGIPNAIAQKL